MPSCARPGCLVVGFQDHGDETIERSFRVVERFINAVGGNVLIHCRSGVSRAVTVGVSYLLLRNPTMSVDRALARVRVVREQAGPNFGFMLALRDFARSLGCPQSPPMACVAAAAAAAVMSPASVASSCGYDTAHSHDNGYDTDNPEE